MKVLKILVVSLALIDCGPRPRPIASPPAPDDPVTPAILRTLSLPPTEATSGSLERLEQAGKRGSCRAAWLRARYLIDLFDAARLLPDDKAYGKQGLSLMWTALDLPGEPSRGRLATRQVLVSLEDALVNVPEACPQRSFVQTAIRLLETDRTSRTTPRDALLVAVRYKEIARSSSPLAPNALARLVDWCTKAFQLAAGAEPSRMRLHLNQCLYPLFDSDPTPYFQADPAMRPPDPPWPVLREALDELRAKLYDTRLKHVGQQLARLDRTFFELAATSLPTPLNLESLTPPENSSGVPWDRTPVVIVSHRGYVVGGQAVLEEDEEALVKAITRRLHNDRRGRVIVVALPSCPATRIVTVARAASLAGAHTLDLGVVRQVARHAPAGDVLSRIFQKRPVLRLEGIPVFLGLLSPSAVRDPARDQPKGMTYDASTAWGKLVLILGRSGLRIASRDGVLAPIRFKMLSARLKTLKKVYPSDRSLVLAPDPSAIYAELADVASRVRATGISGLALSTPGRLPVPPQTDLAPLLRMLSGASVRIDPLLSRTWPDLARGCYLDTLREFVGNHKRPPQGTLTLRTGPKGTRVQGGTLRYRGLRRCISAAFAKETTTRPAAVTVWFNVGSSA